MAQKRAAWGIDIGQSSFKAIKLQYSEATDQVVATAFDYIQYPKILSQPDAIPEEIVADAMNSPNTEREPMVMASSSAAAATRTHSPARI